ncbi:MAG: sulfatase, partial [Planctomycetota bacterium]
DLLATFAAVAERPLPAEDRPDSLDLSPVLHGDPSFTPREILVLQAGANHELIYREGPWKLIIQSDHPLTKFEPRDLFNLDETPLEPAEANLIDDPAHQERVQGMLERYLELRESGAPTVNPGEST